MSEANPNGQRNSNELKELIRELESQIESVNAGLGKIRGTVARIAYASLGIANPQSSSLWPAGLNATPANRQWTSASADTPPAPIAAPDLSFAAEALKPFASPEPEEAPGFWTSVAEGASWPRAHAPEAVVAPADEPKLVADAPVDAFAWTGFGSQPGPGSSPVDATAEPASIHEMPVAEASPEALVPADLTPVASQDPTQNTAEDLLQAESEAGLIEVESPVVETVADLEPQGTTEQGDAASMKAWMQAGTVEPAPAEAPAREAPRKDEAPPAPAVGLPSTLSSGWPDESAWSQSFEWPAMKPEPEAAPHPEPALPIESRAEDHADVSDIVAQVKAELAAARAQGIEFPIDAEFETPAESEQATPLTELDDDARREEVSRAVAEMRAQFEAGSFDGAPRATGFDIADQSFTDAGPSTEAPAGAEDDVRAEVRRAVEAAREELSGLRGGTTAGGEKPAFRLAAPGSIPDWSHMKVEPSGPPVVVMKDADGRVELASVYETLNELGCGDGAALLNYTPHSVTVGLPIASQVPSKEQVADAVEKVFGLASRVESDGVRITVSIGEDPKRRSVA